jgi:hypothetical protein
MKMTYYYFGRELGNPKSSDLLTTRLKNIEATKRRNRLIPSSLSVLS